MGGGESPPFLIAYHFAGLPELDLVPAPRARAWMSETPEGFARRCLPLLIANESGWFLLSPHDLKATWSGSDALDGVSIECDDGAPCGAVSHFGHGILTWTLPYLFRTSPGYNLLVRGPANWPVPGAHPLEGVVETDWAVATFTMNWLLADPGREVHFGRGQPICMLVPQRRDLLEAFVPQTEEMTDNPDLSAAHTAWATSRSDFNARLRDGRLHGDWQKHYFQGIGPDGLAPVVHQTKLRLRAFPTEADGGQGRPHRKPRRIGRARS